MAFSDYVVYVDESGDHGLTKINPEHPVFVLAFCIFRKNVFVSNIVPSVQTLKFDFWGHDGVVLHSHEIRKSRRDFNILINAKVRERFLSRLDSVIGNADFTIIAAAIDKLKHVKKYAYPMDPYGIALAFCMERLQRFLVERAQSSFETHVVVECRGKEEDATLELEFRRICDGQNAFQKMPNLQIRFMDKKHNSTGLQLADLVAHPIGRYVLNPQQPNHAFDTLSPKFRRSAGGQVAGYGLKIFP